MKKYRVTFKAGNSLEVVDIEADEIAVMNDGNLHLYQESNKEGHDKFYKACFSSGNWVAVVRLDS